MYQEQEGDKQDNETVPESAQRAFSTAGASDSLFLRFRKRIYSSPLSTGSLLVVLVLLWNSPVQAHAMSTNSSSFVTYNHFGGNQMACWNAATFHHFENETTTEDTTMFRPSEFTAQQCGSQTELTIDILDSSPFPLGWEVHPGQTIKVDIMGYWMINSTTTAVPSTWNAALVIQLCPIGIDASCSPILPSRPSPATRRVTLDQIPPTDHLMYFEYVSITNGDKIIQKRLALKPKISGIYSILASLVVLLNDPGHSADATELNNSTFLGVSVIPFSSNGREQFIVVHAAMEDDGAPAVVDDWAVVIVFCFCGIGGLTLFVLLALSVHYRKAQVFELTQGKFLLAMLMSSLVATCSLFLMEPKNDTYCRLFHPLVTLPTHIMFAILVGRMWRIRAIISPLLLVTLDKEEHWTSKCVNMVEKLTRYECFGDSVNVSGRKLRRVITDRQLLTVIAFLCLPQILVQILIATISNQGFEIDYDSKFFPDGYATCTLRVFGNFLGTAAFALVLVLFLILLVLTGSSRDLPSLFNETQSIRTIAIVAFRMTVVGMFVVALTYPQPSGPTAQYLILSLISGVTIVHTCVRITWSKVQTARTGNSITVTKLIAAHNRSRFSQESASIQPSIDGLGLVRFDSKAKFREEPTLDPAGSVDGTGTHSQGGRMAGMNLSTLQEEDEAAFQISILNKVQEKQESLPQLYAPEDNNDGNSTDSSVVITMEDDSEYFPSNADVDHVQTLGMLPPPSEITSPENFIGLSSDLTVGYATSRTNSNTPHRTILGRQASRSTMNSLDIDASIPPPIAVTQSDQVVTSRGVQDALQSRLTMRDRERSHRRFVQFSRPDNRNDPMRSSDPISGSTAFHRNATLIPLTIECNPRYKSDVILVDKGVPPPRRLLLRMIDVQKRLARANNAILSGLGLDTTAWEDIRDACITLGEVFVGQVQFNWESEKITDTERRLADAYPSLIREYIGSSTLRQSSSLFEEVPRSPRESLINDDPEWPNVLARTPEMMMQLPVGAAKHDATDDDSEVMKG